MNGPKTQPSVLCRQLRMDVAFMNETGASSRGIASPSCR